MAVAMVETARPSWTFTTTVSVRVGNAVQSARLRSASRGLDSTGTSSHVMDSLKTTIGIHLWPNSLIRARFAAQEAASLADMQINASANSKVRRGDTLW